MKELFDKVSIETSKLLTHSYSTSFSLGIKLLEKEFRNPIYAIYSFIRMGDEIKEYAINKNFCRKNKNLKQKKILFIR